MDHSELILKLLSKIEEHEEYRRAQIASHDKSVLEGQIAAYSDVLSWL